MGAWMTPNPDLSAFRFFAKRTPDERASHDLMRMRTVSDLKKCLGLGRETTEALIALERDGEPDLNPDINLNINKEPHNKARCLFSFDAFMRRLTAALDRFEVPTDEPIMGTWMTYLEDAADA